MNHNTVRLKNFESQNFDLSDYWDAMIGNPGPLIANVAASKVATINNDSTLTAQQKLDKIAALKTTPTTSAAKVVVSAVATDIKDKVKSAVDFVPSLFGDLKWIIILVVVVLVLYYGHEIFKK